MKENYRSYETEELVVMYQSTHKEELLQEIISRNDGLLKNWVWDYRNIPSCESEDLMEEAYIACWKAVENYSTERGVTFTTFLKVNVHQQFNRLYNEATRKKRYTGSAPDSFDRLAEINKESGDIERAFILNCEDYSYIEVREFLDSISGTVKEIAVRLMDGMSKGEVARSLGITPATTTYHLKKLQLAYCNFFGVEV